MTIKRIRYGVFVLFLLWVLASYLISNQQIPTPIMVGAFIMSHPIIWRHFYYSLLRLAAVSVLSYGVGSLLGLWMATSYRARRYILPIVQILYNLPRIVFFPIFYWTIHHPNLSQILLLAFVTAFYIAIPIYESLVALPKQYIWIARSLDFSTGMWVREVAFPAVLPRLILVAQEMFSLVLTLLLITEQFQTTFGIGKYLIHQFVTEQYAGVYATMLFIILINVVASLFFEWLKRRNKIWLKPLNPFNQF
ncbi:ABC transporter permease [Atopobacter phocae]|uniref:ABC transporter permease n=1 Tax=Atopobacter phocae TaxID=136492 RepID=UPI0004709A47|nr:ABC transporter permease subunit [Atopobacter phocae]